MGTLFSLPPPQAFPTLTRDWGTRQSWRQARRGGGGGGEGDGDEHRARVPAFLIIKVAERSFKLEKQTWRREKLWYTEDDFSIPTH